MTSGAAVLSKDSLQSPLKNIVSYASAKKLQTLAEEVRFRSLDETLNQLRLVKDERELAILKEAARLADEAVQVRNRTVKRGLYRDGHCGTN